MVLVARKDFSNLLPSDTLRKINRPKKIQPMIQNYKTESNLHFHIFSKTFKIFRQTYYQLY